MCHPRRVFKLYGEVNSVKNKTINIWLNDGVYLQWKNLHVSAYSCHLQVLTTFSKLEDGRYRPKYVVFSIANKHHHLAIYL